MQSQREVWEGFVALEGIDGSGTTTLLKGLSALLESRDAPFQPTCEPTDSPIGRLIRDAMGKRKPVTPKTLAFLFAADREEHLYGPGGILSHLKKGETVISDRYFFSSLAYQSLNVDFNVIDELNGSFPLPGHIVFLGLPIKVAMGRVSSRDEKEIFEEAPLQIRVAENYRKALDRYADSGTKILELDGTLPPERLVRKTWDFLEELF